MNLRNSSELYIGPLKYTHAVQKIALQERKGVKILETTRSSNFFVVDSGDSLHRAQIRFIFTGLEEINAGVNSDGQSGLRALIALFKSCPIVSLENEFLTSAWKNQDVLNDKENYEKVKQLIADNSKLNKAVQAATVGGTTVTSLLDNSFATYNEYLIQNLNKNLSSNNVAPVLKGFNDSTLPYSFGSMVEPLSPQDLKQNKYYSNYVPVALERIDIENVPDLVNTLQATLTISRIDISPISESEGLFYLGENGEPVEYPRGAHWLTKWINQVLDNSQVPFLSEEDFQKTTISWYGKDTVGNPIAGPQEQVTLDITTNKQSQGILLSESCSFAHKFAFNKLQGKIYSFATHMGVSGKSLSFDIVFNNQSSNREFLNFCKFKETSDVINKSLERFDRIYGWNIKSPVTKLLYSTTYKKPLVAPGETIFVPLSIDSETTDLPNVINVKVDFLENNIRIAETSEMTLISGGTELKELRKFYDNITDKEIQFRAKGGTSALLDSVMNNDELYQAYIAFWPVEKSLTDIKKDSKFGILNADTLRAALIHRKVDSTNSIKEALLKEPLAVGKYVANRKINITDQLKNLPILFSIISGVSGKEEQYFDIYNAILNIVKNCFEYTGSDSEKFYVEMAQYITGSYLGNRTSGLIGNTYTSIIFDKLSKSNIRFSNSFKDALFNVIIERKPKDIQLPYIYSTDGIYTAFYKLITKYSLEKQPVEQEYRKEISNFSKDIQGLYPDLLLPTYYQLFEDQWEQFAPSFDDLGLEYVEDRSKPCVNREDLVSPAAWFYKTRTKDQLRKIAKESVESTNKVSEQMSLSIPFNTEEIEDIKRLIREKKTSVPGSKSYQIADSTLSELITNSLEKFSKSNPSGFREDYVKLASKFEDKYYGGKDNIKLYLHHQGNYSIPREVTVPGLGGEIYRVISKAKLLTTDILPRLDADSVFKTPIDKEIEFHRHLDSSTQKCITSAIDQITDDIYGPERMFPAVKVYLIDKRGNDLIADDSIFSVSSILSIDITMDKEDAPLAVIKLADPLYHLQSSYFENKNTYKTENETRVLGSLRGPDKDSYIKRYKLIQGRAIQIRMGYSSMAYNLPITFTGRITEIVPGDELTIVAQGWKAELINRQVSFNCDDPKNWGARDLAIQAITYANPEGFGEFFPEHDAAYILKNLNPEAVDEVLNRSIENNQNIDLENVGERSLLGDANNWLARSIGRRSIDKDDKGFDTRLKNIWYPDTALYSNPFGLRSVFGVMPAWHNDSWIVPLQPAWDVLKEASRHAWNCIVDVVPYDGEATIFMGHPDQPYFYTRGNAYTNKKYKDNQKQKLANTKEIIGSLLKSFESTSFYKSYGPSNLELLINFTPTPGSNKIEEEIANFVKTTFNDFYSFMSYEELRNYIQDSKKLLDSVFGKSILTENIYKKLLSSSIPAVYLDRVKSSIGDSNISVNLAGVFFGIEDSKIYQFWPSVVQDVDQILSNDVTVKNLELINRLSSLKSNASKRAELEAIKDYIKLEYATNVRRPSRLDYILDELIKLIPEHATSLRKYKEYNRNQKDVRKIFTYVWDLVINKLKEVDKNNYVSYRINNESIDDTLILFKGFVYFFSQYLLNDTEASKKVKSLDNSKQLAPNMKVFRMHHFVDSDHSIIKNSIVATTREMWNTVVIEHPKPGSAESQVESEEQVYREGRIGAGIEWVYYPRNEVTGVIGLQFHPGLTLSNKKIQVFTELNCQNPDLAAKLACHHLAEGVKKMYRGTLTLIGKNMKPYDRIIISDAYTKMSGPIEVESLVHHWNSDQGWITNIIPQAVCDANPGAGILHTAIMETTYQFVYNTIDAVSDALTLALIVSTVGGAAPLALGQFSVKQGLKGLLTRFGKGGIKGGINETWNIYKNVAKDTLKNKIPEMITASKNPMQLVTSIVKTIGGPAKSYFVNQALIAGAQWGTHMSYKSTVIPAFIESSNDVDQLPVILSPLIFNGTPFIAGLESEDSIWGLSAFGAYYSSRKLQEGARKILDDFWGNE